jgi:hypothetical protein
MVFLHDSQVKVRRQRWCLTLLTNKRRIRDYRKHTSQEHFFLMILSWRLLYSNPVSLFDEWMDRWEFQRNIYVRQRIEDGDENQRCLTRSLRLTQRMEDESFAIRLVLRFLICNCILFCFRSQISRGSPFTFFLM